MPLCNENSLSKEVSINTCVRTCVHARTQVMLLYLIIDHCPLLIDIIPVRVDKRP